MIVDTGARRGMDTASEKPPCCAPDAPDRHQTRPTISIAAGEGAGSTEDMASLAGGAFLIGSDDRWAYPEDGEGPVRRVSIGPFWIDRHAVSNARFDRVRRGDRVRHRGGALRLVVRLRRAAPRRLPAHPGRGPGALVAEGGGGGLAPPRGPTVIDRRPSRPPGPARLLERRPGLLRLGREAPAHRGRVGVRGPRRARGKGLSLGRRAGTRWGAPDERLARHLPKRQHARRRLLRHLRG